MSEPSSTFLRAADFLRASRNFDRAVVDAFLQHLATAPDEDLFRMNPLRYARGVGLDERISVDLFLYATHAGLLEFTWGVLCQLCRGFLTTPGALRSLKGARHCSLCDCDTAPGDDNLEVAFTVAEAVRSIRFHDLSKLDYRRDGLKLNFSPSLNIPDEVKKRLGASVVHSGTVRAGELETATLRLEPGKYRISVPSEHAWLHIHVEEGAAQDRLDADLGDGHIVPVKVVVRPGEVLLRLKNRCGHPVLYGVTRNIEGLRLVDAAKVDAFLSGKKLVTTQAFRELFRSESIPSDAGLHFKSLTVVFTDLKGSTAMYERIGDFNAYELVRQHFNLLRDIIRRSGGAMVKTIGDAIMASFADAGGALDAAAAMNAEIARIGAGELQLKIGLHTGPAIAVELNEQLDYFGQTVNVAARVQGLAEGGEIVCTDAVWDSPGVRGRAQVAGLSETLEQAHLKGVEGAVAVHRLRSPEARAHS